MMLLSYQLLPFHCNNTGNYPKKKKLYAAKEEETQKKQTVNLIKAYSNNRLH